MTRAFLSLGSNIEPEEKIREAIKHLCRHVRILRVSTVYITVPWGRKDQPKFYNCMLEIETTLSPKKLKFSVLRHVEKELGRKRTKDKFAPRTIDIDIATYNDLYVSARNLKIPDPNINERAFLALPLHELEPDLRLPPEGTPIRLIAKKLGKHGMIALKRYTQSLQRLVERLSMQ